MRRLLAILVSCAIGFVALGSTAASAAGNPPPSPAPIQISDSLAKTLAQKYVGSYAASRMLHRVTILPAQPTNPTYYTTSPTPVPGQTWAGYEVRSDALDGYPNADGAQGHFNALQNVGGSGVVGTWVGVGGGYPNDTGNIIQTGISNNLMQAWYELLPSPAVYVFSVNSNDEMVADTSYVGSGDWYIDIQDLTTGVYYAATFSFTPDQSTAEWVMEDGNGGTSTIGTNFTTDFQYCTWLEAVSGEPAVPINSSDDGYLYELSFSNSYGSLTPSGLRSTGEGFSVAAAP